MNAVISALFVLAVSFAPSQFARAADCPKLQGTWKETSCDPQLASKDKANKVVFMQEGCENLTVINLWTKLGKVTRSYAKTYILASDNEEKWNFGEAGSVSTWVHGAYTPDTLEYTSKSTEAFAGQPVKYEEYHSRMVVKNDRITGHLVYNDGVTGDCHFVRVSN